MAESVDSILRAQYDLSERERCRDCGGIKLPSFSLQHIIIHDARHADRPKPHRVVMLAEA